MTTAVETIDALLEQTLTRGGTALILASGRKPLIRATKGNLPAYGPEGEIITESLMESYFNEIGVVPWEPEKRTGFVDNFKVVVKGNWNGGLTATFTVLHTIENPTDAERLYSLLAITLKPGNEILSFVPGVPPLLTQVHGEEWEMPGYGPMPYEKLEDFIEVIDNRPEHEYGKGHNWDTEVRNFNVHVRGDGKRYTSLTFLKKPELLTRQAG